MDRPPPAVAWTSNFTLRKTSPLPAGSGEVNCTRGGFGTVGVRLSWRRSQPVEESIRQRQSAIEAQKVCLGFFVIALILCHSRNCAIHLPLLQTFPGNFVCRLIRLRPAADRL